MDARSLKNLKSTALKMGVLHSGRSQPFKSSSSRSLNIFLLVLLASLKKHGPSPSSIEDKTLSDEKILSLLSEKQHS